MRRDEKHPKVSIVIPVYNGSNYLKEAMDSALSQTYKNIEVLVINDGSNDNGATEKIAKSYGNKIRYFHKANGGVATALNLGIEKMTGEYFSWLSHDDKYVDSKIKDQISLVRKLGKNDIIIASNVSVLFEDGTKKKEYIDSNAFKYMDIFLSTSAVTGLNGCSLLIPKWALVKTGGFDEKLPYTQDYDLWFRLKEHCSFVLLEKHLVTSRRHDKQYSVLKQKMCFEDAEDLHYRFLNEIPNERFRQFFNENAENIRSYWNNYCVYKLNNYKKTASMMLKYLLKYYAEKDRSKFGEVLKSEIGTIVQRTSIKIPKTKNRLLFFSNVWHRGGVGNVLSFIFREFAEKYDCILVTCNDGINKNLGYELPKSVCHIKINNDNQLAELLNIISLYEVDVFIGNPNFLEKFLDIYPLLERLNVKSIAYNHGHYFLPYTTGEYLYPAAIKIKDAYKSADYVVWLSQIAYGLYGIDSKNGLYIPNPVLIDKRISPKNKPGKKLLAVGRFDDEVKRIDDTLLVFKELYRIDKGFTLDVVGYCPMDMELAQRDNMKLGEFIKTYDIPVENIRFLGEQNNVSEHYRKANLLILTSRREGFSLVLTEALSHGVPCACFEYIGLEEIVKNGINGWVVPQGDHQGLARKIDDTIDDERQYLQMSQNSLKSVAKFDVELFNKRWSLLIDTALGKRDLSQLGLLQPSRRITRVEYDKVISEYESAIIEIIKNYQSKQPSVIYINQNIDQKQDSAVRAIAKRLKSSIDSDGVMLTAVKIAAKPYRMIKSRLVRN